MTQLFFRTSGTPGTPMIVLLHGGGVGGWMWRGVMAQLPEFFCLEPDMPEQGQSQDVKPFSIERTADLIAELIREQAPAGQAVVVGLSAGAQVAVALLARQPHVVERAVISSALVRALPGTAWMSKDVYRWSYRMAMAGKLKTWDAWVRLNMRYAAGIPEEYFADFKADFARITADGLANLLHASMNYRLPQGLPGVRVPALVLAGAKEYRAMRQSACDLTALLPNAVGKMHSLGALSRLAQEHNWAVTAPQLFAQTLRAWVTGAGLPEFLSDIRCE